MNKLNKLIKDTRGGAFVEYIVVTALVALGAAAAFNSFKDDVGDTMEELGSQVKDVVGACFVGDIDGDGKSEYAAGLSTLSGLTGKLVWFSGATGVAFQQLDAAQGALASYGFPMDPIGDVTGDGVIDLCIGNSGFNGAFGRAWIHDGRTGALLHTIDGQANDEYFGMRACGLGDVDGDGRGDLAISARSGRSAIQCSGSTRGAPGPP